MLLVNRDICSCAGGIAIGSATPLVVTPGGAMVCARMLSQWLVIVC